MCPSPFIPVPLIEDGVVSGMFENISLQEEVSASFPSNLTSLPVLLQSTSLDTLYFVMNINSLNTSVGLACPDLRLGQIDTATDQSKS